MNRDNRSIFTETRRPKAFRRVPAESGFWSRHMRADAGADIAAIAHAEGWLMPPAEITRIHLRPWQQAVFWGLRLYIGVMLIVMIWGFFHVAGG
jgi:hypothetical protein